jgi:hypothetical protein
MASFATRVAGILLAGSVLMAGAQEVRHGRKYVAPPPAAHISVTVLKDTNGKPVANAAVIFHPIKNGKDGGNMEIKTNREGIATLDIMPVGDTFRLQVIADGFQTFGEDYTIDSSVKEIEVKMKKPVKQASIYATPPGSPATTTSGAQGTPSGSAPK